MDFRLKPRSSCTYLSVMKIPTLVGLVACLASSISCMTTYDAYGRPVQSVDPGVAIAGAAAAGMIGYAAANNNDHHHSHYHRGGYYHQRPYYYRPHGGYYRPY